MPRRKSMMERAMVPSRKGKKKWDPFKPTRKGKRKSMADSFAARADFGGKKSKRRRKGGGDMWGFKKLFARAEKSYSAYDPIVDRMTGRDEARREIARERERMADERMTGLPAGQVINAQNPIPRSEEPQQLNAWQRLVAFIARLRGEA